MLANVSRLACTQMHAAAQLEDVGEAKAFGAITEVADVYRYWTLRAEQPWRNDGMDCRGVEPWAEELFAKLLAEV